MKKFKEFRIGDQFQSTSSISERELESYLGFARLKNALLDHVSDGGKKMIPGRAILSRTEGEFTRLSQIHGNEIVLLGADGDPDWDGRNMRFVNSLYADDMAVMRFVISGKEDVDDTYGRLLVDYEVTSPDGNTILVSRKNIYRIKKDPHA